MCGSKLIECGTCYDPYSYGIDNAPQPAHTQLHTRSKTLALLLVVRAESRVTCTTGHRVTCSGGTSSRRIAQGSNWHDLNDFTDATTLVDNLGSTVCRV